MDLLTCVIIMCGQWLLETAFECESAAISVFNAQRYGTTKPLRFDTQPYKYLTLKTLLIPPIV